MKLYFSSFQGRHDFDERSRLEASNSMHSNSQGIEQESTDEAHSGLRTLLVLSRYLLCSLAIDEVEGGPDHPSELGFPDERLSSLMLLCFL